MKKLMMFFAVALMVLTGTAKALDVDLVADGGSPATAVVVGNVNVTNNATNVTVTISINAPWIMTSSKVHVATTLAAIPQNKNGNPQAGQFGWKEPDAGYTDTLHVYTIPFVDIPASAGNLLYIAVHATVWDTDSETLMVIASSTDTDVIEVNGIPTEAKAVAANEPFSYPACSSYTPDDTSKSIWDNGIGTTAFNFFDADPTADWIWNTLNPVNPILGDVVTFEPTLDVPGLPVGGILSITADNGYEVMLNDVSVGSAQLGPGFPDTLMEKVDGTPQTGDWGVASQGWQSVEEYLLTTLVSGENSLVITAANEYMWNTSGYLGPDFYYGNYDPSGGTIYPDPAPGSGIGGDNICRNPGAVIFKAAVSYYERDETAWGAGTQFNDKKSWATYFTYESESDGD